MLGYSARTAARMAHHTLDYVTDVAHSGMGNAATLVMNGLGSATSSAVDHGQDAWADLDQWLHAEEPERESPIPDSVLPIDPLSMLLSKDRLNEDEIAAARAFIVELPSEEQATRFAELQTKVEYSNQRNNESDSEGSSGGTCSLTSLAMCLKYLGVPNPNPAMQYEDALDQIRIEHDLGPITTAATWGKIAQHLGHDMVEIPGGVYDRTWWMTVLGDEYLNAGYGVLASIQGHVVRLQGVTSEGVVSDDPYGKSVLGQGKDRSWDGLNTDAADGTHEENVGEDNVWPWESVEAFEFKYFRAFK